MTIPKSEIREYLDLGYQERQAHRLARHARGLPMDETASPPVPVSEAPSAVVSTAPSAVMTPVFVSPGATPETAEPKEPAAAEPVTESGAEAAGEHRTTLRTRYAEAPDSAVRAWGKANNITVRGRLVGTDTLVIFTEALEEWRALKGKKPLRPGRQYTAKEVSEFVAFIEGETR
jgi:hypothetical protein